MIPVTLKGIGSSSNISSLIVSTRPPLCGARYRRRLDFGPSLELLPRHPHVRFEYVVPTQKTQEIGVSASVAPWLAKSCLRLLQSVGNCQPVIRSILTTIPLLDTGSAIYTASIRGLIAHPHVSQVHATWSTLR